MVRPVSAGSGLQTRSSEDTSNPAGSSARGPVSQVDEPPQPGDGALRPRPQRLAEEAMPMRPRAVAGAQAVSLAAIQAEGPSITSPSRRQAIDLMTQVKARFEALLRLNWAPDQVDKAFDIAVMPVVVAAENARNPDLRLTFLESPDELKDWLALEAPGGERRRAVFNLPGFEEHSMVADVRRVDGRTSVLLVEPLDPNNDLATKYDTAVLPAFRSLNLLPRRAVLSALALGTQKSDTGCRIFALSFASKLAGLKAEVDLIHEQNQAGAPLSTSIGFPLQKWAGTRDRRMFSGTALMPQPFMKHAQSSDTLKDWHAAHQRSPWTIRSTTRARPCSGARKSTR